MGAEITPEMRQAIMAAVPEVSGWKFLEIRVLPNGEAQIVYVPEKS